MKYSSISRGSILRDARNRRKARGRGATTQQMVEELQKLQRRVHETVTTATLHLGLQSELQPGAPWNEPRFWSEMVRQMERDRQGFLDEVESCLSRMPGRVSPELRGQATGLARKIESDMHRFGQVIRHTLPRLNREMEFAGRYATEPTGHLDLALNLIHIITLFFRRFR
jgi:hypothetical protein